MHALDDCFTQLSVKNPRRISRSPTATKMSENLHMPVNGPSAMEFMFHQGS